MCFSLFRGLKRAFISITLIVVTLIVTGLAQSRISDDGKTYIKGWETAETFLKMQERDQLAYSEGLTDGWMLATAFGAPTTPRVADCMKGMSKPPDYSYYEKVC